MYGPWLIVIFASTISIAIAVISVVIMKRNRYVGDKYFITSFSLFIISVMTIMVIMFLKMLSLSEVKNFIKFKEYVESINFEHQDEDEETKQKIRSKTEKMNEWLKSAKSNKETYKNWSIYFWYNLNEFSEILLDEYDGDST